MTKLTVRQARALLTSPENQEKVSTELGHIAQADITDVISWTGDVAVLNASDTLAPHVRKAIKKVRITPGKYGNSIEVEMHDKLGALRMLARATGMMDQTLEESNRPTMIGIKLNLSKVEEVIYAKENRRDGSESTDGE